MIGRIVLTLALTLTLACGAGAASAQETCALYRVNTSVLNISKEAGGILYNDALFDGDNACVTRTVNVKGVDWAFISHKVQGQKFTPVEGWAALQYLQPVPASPPPAAGSPPPAAGATPAPPGAAPSPAPGATAAIRPEDVLRFEQPIPFGPYPLNGRTLKQLIDSVPMFPPIEGIDESLWKKNCTGCHQWNQARLCEQAKTYVETPRNALRVPHPFGGTLKIALMRWAKSGCL